MDKHIKVLIEKIRKGDEGAFTQLLEEYRRMIYKIIYSFDLNNGDFRVDENDLFQEACLALYDAVFSFEQGRNVQFSTYAYMVIRSRIMTLLRNISRSAGNETISLDSHADHSLKFAVNEDPQFYHREELFREKLDRFITALSSEDRQILELKNEKLTYQQISQRLGISVKRVDNRLRSMKRKLKEEMLNLVI
jgi:RNA polymerase sigma-70 factor (ECF subfamily)